MISAIVYLINSIVLGIFCFKIYSTGRGKKEKNPFIVHFSWATLFMTISFYKAAMVIPIAILNSDANLLFWEDFAGRALFYAAAVASVPIPLYKFFPKSKKVKIIPYIFAIIGFMLLIYQFYHRNIPVINSTGIISWNADIVMSAGMGILLIIPWILISFIFIKEFIKGKFRQFKPLLQGAGFFLICVGTIFQDSVSSPFYYILFSSLAVIGFLSVSAGFFYKGDD